MRTSTTLFSGRFALMTMSVQELQIVDSVTPSLFSRDEVIDFDHVAIGEIQLARAASSCLKLQESGHSRVDRRMAS